MDTELLKLKIKRYISQYEYLINEYEETQYLFEKYKKEFYNECPKKKNDKNDTNEKDTEKNTEKNTNNTTKDTSKNTNEDTAQNNEEESSNNDSNISKIISKLYKKLCLKTHPDKDKSNTYIKKFDEISNAYNSKDFLKLLLLSRELNIDTISIINEDTTHTEDTEYNKDSTDPKDPKDPKDPVNSEKIYTTLFEKSINDINEKIKSIKSTLAWNWALSTPEQKQQLRERFLS